jgi:redox-sensitive bicupin YhaK (pirin superfamily)
VGPFVFLDHFGPITVKDGPGIPAHPHAGIEVITYLFEGEQVHRDSLGNRSRVGAGGAQWITAGRGVIHAEKPDVGSVIHGVQIWASLPRALKHIEPRYQGVQAAGVPSVSIGAAAIRILAGELSGSTGPIALAQPSLLFHIKATAETAIPVPPEFHLGIYRLTGQLDVLSPGEAVTFPAGEYILLGGEPAEEPLLFGGPFVMDTPEHLQQAQRDYHQGRMGTLDGVPF